MDHEFERQDLIIFLEAISLGVSKILEEIPKINRKLEKIMSDQSDLNALASEEETDIAALTAAVPGIQTGLNNLNDALTAAVNDNPALDLSAITKAQVDLHTALAAVEGISIPTPPTTTPPVTAPPVTTPPVTTPPPVTAPTAPTSTDTVDPASSLPLYSFPVGTTVPAGYTQVTDVVDSNGNVLFTFSGDSANAAPTGEAAAVYTGSTQAFPSTQGVTGSATTGTAAS
jgi:hypothetical protein